MQPDRSTNDEMELDLLRQVVAEPDDLAVRLVCADWYDEQGDPRGEFIRLQLQLARPDLSDTTRAVLRTREAALLRENVRRWNGPLHRLLYRGGLKNCVGSRRKSIRGWTYRRGFVEELSIDAATFAENAPLLSQLGPIRRLRLFDASTRAVVQRVVDALPTGTIQSLVVRDHGLHPAHLVPIALSSHVSHLVEVDLRGSGVGRVAGEAIFHGLGVRVLSDEEPQPYVPPPPVWQRLPPPPAPTRLTASREVGDGVFQAILPPLALFAFLGFCAIGASLDKTSSSRTPDPASINFASFESEERRQRRLAELRELLEKLKKPSEDERERAFVDAFVQLSAIDEAKPDRGCGEPSTSTVPDDALPPPPAGETEPSSKR